MAKRTSMSDGDRNEISKARAAAKRSILRRMYAKTKDTEAKEIIKNEALGIPQEGRRRIMMEEEE